jgi:hypothetical protein
MASEVMLDPVNHGRSPLTLITPGIFSTEHACTDSRIDNKKAYLLYGQEAWSVGLLNRSYHAAIDETLNKWAATSATLTTVRIRMISYSL